MNLTPCTFERKSAYGTPTDNLITVRVTTSSQILKVNKRIFNGNPWAAVKPNVLIKINDVL